MARLVVQLGLLWAHACADDFVARRVREIAGEHGATGHQALSRYEAHQGSKLTHRIDSIRPGDLKVEAHLYKHWHLYRRDPWTRPEYDLAGKAVLCVGARLGGEVRALTRLGALAVGIDFNPGPRNPWVQWGDATRLQFANGTFDYVYTNVVDHIAPLERFYADATRVLKPGGRLVLHAAWNPPDKWSMQTFTGGTDELVAKLLAETPLKMVFRQKYPGNMTDPTRALMTSFVGGDEIIVEKPFS